MQLFQAFLILGELVWGGVQPKHETVPAPASWPGWDRYQVIMWSTGQPKDLDLWFQRLREMECTAEECYRGRDPSPFVEHDFGFYAENLVPQLAYLHSRRKLYDEDFEGYTRTHDPRFLARRPCFHDPAFWEEIRPYLERLVRPYVPHHPLLYNLQDELSIGSFASPMDYCFTPFTLAAFRGWLRQRYGSLEALNREWETDFDTWDAVRPMTTYEIKERERVRLASGEPENYAPWADHREFMDRTFARTLARLRGIIRELDPDVPVGIEGTQMPSCWGGYDLWQLSQVIDWIEPYDIANSREIFRSFLPQHAPVLGTVFGHDYPRLRRKLWWLAIHGDRGCIIWDDEKSRCIEKTRETMPLTERGRELASIFAELKREVPKLFAMERVDDRIAIHYSQASIRAHWMFESREDGDTWPRRLSSYEARHSRFARVRDSFVRVIEDLGLQYRFLAYEQIESGALLSEGYRVLILPQSVAMSARECEQIEAFVRAGGVVIADNMTATMDEHGRRLREGQLDRLFGIRRTAVEYQARPTGTTLTWVAEADPLHVFETDVELTSGIVPADVEGTAVALVEHRVGEGKALYLNLDMHDYGKLRLTPPRGANYRALFRRLLTAAGVFPGPIQVVDPQTGAPLPCVEVWRFRGAGEDIAAILRNPEFDADSLAGYGDNSALEQPIPARVIWDHAEYRKRTGRAFEREFILDPWRPTLISISSP